MIEVVLRIVGRLLSPIRRQIFNLISRGIISVVNAEGGLQVFQCKLLSGEVKAGLEYFENYGVSAVPHEGAELLAGFLGGDRSKGIVIAATDRRYRPKDLEKGDSALYDDKEQFVKLKKEGVLIHGKEGIFLQVGAAKIQIVGGQINIDAGGVPLTLTNAPNVDFDTPSFRVSGEIVAPSFREGGV